MIAIPDLNETNNEQRAAKAFSKQSVLFDEIYSGDPIIQYKRKRVRDHVMRLLAPASYILELNAGTGEDAVYFAQHGHHVHATDISPGMQEKLVNKVRAANLQHRISNETCSFTSLENLEAGRSYDLVFSNFAGLNCTGQLGKVLHSFPTLVKQGGLVTLVILPECCLWEFLLLFRGRIKTALRRFSGKKGAQSHVEGEYFTCWYYNPSYVTAQMKNDFEHIQTEALCTFVPPSYLKNFAVTYPRLFFFLCRIENRLRFSWPWRSIGDYYIISFRRK